MKWIMKAPFTTNSQHFKRYVDTVQDAMIHLNRVLRGIYFDKECYEIPYMLLQERAMDNSEVKLCFLDRKFSHILSSAGHPKSLSGFSKTDLITFAYNTLQYISDRDDSFILDGLVRVDLFRNNEGKLVVNELESLEAVYYSTALEEEGQTREFLQNYWATKIYDCINKL